MCPQRHTHTHRRSAVNCFFVFFPKLRGGWQQMPSALLGIMGLFLHGRHCDLLKREHRGETNPISNGSISHISCQPRQKQEPWCVELNIKISLTCVRRQRFQGPESQRPFCFVLDVVDFTGWDGTQRFPIRAASRLAAMALTARSLKQALGSSLSMSIQKKTTHTHTHAVQRLHLY